jgi:hypothetical protein
MAERTFSFSLQFFVCCRVLLLEWFAARTAGAPLSMETPLASFNDSGGSLSKKSWWSCAGAVRATTDPPALVRCLLLLCSTKIWGTDCLVCRAQTGCVMQLL